MILRDGIDRAVKREREVSENRESQPGEHPQITQITQMEKQKGDKKKGDA